MAMKKAEMELHQQNYHGLMERARVAERLGLYREAIDHALEAMPFVDGMMQFERRYENKDFRSVPAFEMAMKYAPLLMDAEVLTSLEGLLKERRRIEKNTEVSLGDKLTDAWERMWEAHSLWTHIEQEPGCRQDQLREILGGEQERWRTIAETWEHMGLLHREPEGGSYRLSLLTRLGQLVPAKCPACGVVIEVPKAMCFEDTSCPECSVTSLFVILSEDNHIENKG